MFFDRYPWYVAVMVDAVGHMLTQNRGDVGEAVAQR